MSRRLHYGLLTAVVFLIPSATGAAWWFYWPTYHRNRLLREAEQEISAHNLAKAAEVLRQLVQEEPNQPRPHLLLAQVLRRLGRKQEAWIALHRAQQQGLPETEGLREYALLEAGEDFGRGERALLRVLEEAPDDLEAWQALAEGYVREGRWLDAERAYTHCLEAQPDRIDFLLERGRSLLEAGRLDLAEGDFRHLLRQSSRHYQARLWLAHCLLGTARIEEAEAELLICRRLLPARSEPLVGLATCAAERADLDRAQALVKEALTLDPSSPVALHLQGGLWLRRRRYDLAVLVFEEILRHNPRDKVAHLNLAQALSHGSDPARARKHERLYQQLDREEEERLRKSRRPH